MSLRALIAVVFAVFASNISVSKAGSNHGYPYMPQKYQWAAQIDRVISNSLCSRLLLNSPDSDFLNPKVLFSNFAEEDVIAGEKFALDEMVKSKVMSKEQAKTYLESTIEIEPGRLTYVAVSRYRVRPAFYVGDQGGPLHGVYEPPSRISFLRMVAGHDNDGAAKELPWMTEPELAPLVSLVDRSKPSSKYIYEWGRAADVERQGMIRENVALMSYLAARDVVLAGGSVSEAEIQVHSTTKYNTANYKERYGFKPLGEVGEHTILTKPLSKLLKEFKPWNFIPLLAKIMRLEHATPDKAIAIHERLKQYRLTARDLVLKDSGELEGILWASDRSAVGERAGDALLDELMALGASRDQAKAIMGQAARAQDVESSKPYVLLVAHEANVGPAEWVPAAAENYVDVFSSSERAHTVFIVEAVDKKSQNELMTMGFEKHDETHYAISADDFIALKNKKTRIDAKVDRAWKMHVRNNL